MLESIFYRLKKIMLEYHFQHDCFVNDNTYLYNYFYNASKYMKGISKLIRKFIGNKLPN